MNFLFVHTNFPAQFKHIAARLAANPAHRVRAIGSQSARDLPGVALQRYRLEPAPNGAIHPFARAFDGQCRRAEQVLYAAMALRAQNFVPDVVVVHSGWGENLPLRNAFPKARIVVYCEYFYRATGQDVNFDPEFGDMSLDGMTGLSIRNANGLLALVDADDGLAPTRWQRSTYPKVLQPKITVIHEGIDTAVIAPDPAATFTLPDGRTFRKGDPLVTFAARNLEPLRGYHVFMRALPRIMKACPQAHVIAVGGSGVSYGAPPPRHATWKAQFLDEVFAHIDPARLHFLDFLPHERFLRLLKVSCVHVYFTYPFVLSWSLIEAMSAGCVLVASDTAPVQDVLDERAAILVPFLDSYSLAESTVQVLRAPAQHAHLARAARALVQAEYDVWSKTLPAMERFLMG